MILRKNSLLNNKSRILTFLATYDSGDVLLRFVEYARSLEVSVTNEKKSYKLEPLEELKIKILIQKIMKK